MKPTIDGSETRRRARAGIGRRPIRALCAPVVVGLCLAFAPAAMAATLPNLTWKGEGSTSETQWSVAENWLGDVAPKAEEAFKTLTFPELNSPACTEKPETKACYHSTDENLYVSAEEFKIDDGDNYVLSVAGKGEVELGAGGLTAAPEGATSGARDEIAMGVELSKPQTWHIVGLGGTEGGENGLLLEELVEGEGHELKVQQSEESAFVVGSKGEVEVSSLAIEGKVTGEAGFKNGTVELHGGGLNAFEGHPVKLSHIALAGYGEVGKLKTEDAELNIGSGSGSLKGLNATSVELDAASKTAFQIDGPGPEAKPEEENSELISEGTTKLAGVIEVNVLPPGEGQPCPVLPVGAAYELVESEKTMSGTFSNAPAGGEIRIHYAAGCASRPVQSMKISYITSGKEGEVTGTVEAGAKEYPLTVNVNPSGAGTVKCEDKTESPGSKEPCKSTYPEDDVVALTQEENAPFKFLEWGGECSDAGACEVTMSKAVAVEAKYKEETRPEFPVEVTVLGGGEVNGRLIHGCTESGSGGAACLENREETETVELTASEKIPANGTGPGWRFTGWSGSGFTCAGGASAPICKFTMPGKAVKPTASYAEVFLLTGEVEGHGEIAGKGMACKTGDTGACSVESEAENEEIELEAKAEEPGWALEKWEGCTSSAGEKCKVLVSEASTVKAVFAAVEVALEVEVKGHGTVTGNGVACEGKAGGGNTGTCTVDAQEGETVELTASGASQWKLASWSGSGFTCAGGTSANPCKFIMPATPVKIVAEFEETHAFPLTVWVTGAGKVMSGTGTNGGSIACTGPANSGLCTEAFEGEVTLTAAEAGTGYTFVGWLGCRSSGAETCKVDVTAETEVTAVFLEKGKEGKEGKEGGKGEQGTPGAAGAQGKEGAAGQNGAQGPAGPAGPAGATGPSGPSGPSGPAGPAGKEGPPGKVQVVTCTTKGKKKKCTTKTVSGTVKFTASSARAMLSRHGSVFAAGVASVGRGRMSLRLQALRHLAPGRYTLTLTSGSGRHERIRTESFTLS